MVEAIIFPYFMKVKKMKDQRRKYYNWFHEKMEIFLNIDWNPIISNTYFKIFGQIDAQLSYHLEFNLLTDVPDLL